MAYKNNNRNNSRSNSGNNRNSSKDNDYVKKSGCHRGEGKNGVDFVSAWNVGKKGFTTLIACPAKEPRHSVTKNGELRELKQGWERWVATVEFKPSNSYKKEKSTHTAFLKLANGKLYIPDLTMVASDKTNYFGRCYKPNNS